MRKLFLLLTTGLFAVSVANAQQAQNSVVFTPKANQLNAGRKTIDFTKHGNTFLAEHANHTAKKTTGGPYSDWFFQWNQNAQSGISQGYYFPTYQDSTVKTTDTTNVFFMGMGMSFDPTDQSYYQTAQVTPVVRPVYQEDAYAVDSFFMLGKYMRFDNYTDSLIVDFVVATPGASDGSYYLQFTGTDQVISADSLSRFTDAAYYNGDLNDNITATKQRYAFALDASTVSDTDANGDNETLFALQPALNVPAGSKVVAYAHFVSGHAYPIGSMIDTVNNYRFYAGELFGNTWTQQSASDGSGSAQCGLAGTLQCRYANQTNFFTAPDGTTPILVPSVAYYYPAGNSIQTPGFSTPQMAFHLTWSSTVGVQNVNKVINNVNAYPNPAVAELNIPFTLNQNAKVTVTLTNAIGQVVSAQDMGNIKEGKATFNVSALPAGMYIYTINADGTRFTGRTVVAH